MKRELSINEINFYKNEEKTWLKTNENLKIYKKINDKKESHQIINYYYALRGKSGKVIDYPNSLSETLTLNNKQENILNETIKAFLSPYITNSCNADCTSYGLKHTFENILNFYISNMDFKEAMKNNGIWCKWQVHEYNISPNCYYYFSKRANKYICKLEDTLYKNNLFINTNKK